MIIVLFNKFQESPDDISEGVVFLSSCSFHREKVISVLVMLSVNESDTENISSKLYDYDRQFCDDKCILKMRESLCVKDILGERRACEKGSRITVSIFEQ